ncbi:Chitotriosidase-1 [Portunus trituberculatus]|uniref:Chitotriosidase-1 n=2 Tax=Portunus trituberculatus TaxID=210409 RepID=A0A5B7G0C8_PORTR|nr:Chitotriosidase-1 [Portunus trituberculatus]
MVRVEGNWTTLIQDAQAVAVFAYNTRKFLHTLNFDGLEVAWQPPMWPPWRHATVQQVSLLLLQLNNALQLASHPPFTLSMAVSASQDPIDHAYDVTIINRTVDFVSLASYDFHTYRSSLPFTGHGSPLKPQKAEHGHWATLNTEWAVKHWLSKGLPREKLVVVIPTYANTWKLLSSSWIRVGAPAVGLGLMEGRMTHPQVCTFVQKGSAWHWDEASRVPYAWNSCDWISYEDESSVKEKAQLVVAEGLAGVAVLDLNSDDWGGLCPEVTTFPLLRAAKDVLSRFGL